MKDSRYDKSHKVCVVSIYGESLGKGVKYELETVMVQTLPAPTEPEYRKDTNHTYATYVDQEYSSPCADRHTRTQSPDRSRLPSCACPQPY